VEQTEQEPNQAVTTEEERSADRDPDVPAWGESERSALHRVRELVDEQRGRLESRVKKIQDSPELRRLVVAVLKAAERSRPTDDTRSDGKDE
jgi:hypothetical protein